MRGLVVLLALFCVNFVFCDHADVKLGSFEGTYLSPFGLGMYVCQDDLRVQGYLDEHIIFSGEVFGETLKGEYHAAGTGPCTDGTIELTRTSYGLQGFYVCKGNGKVFTVQGSRTSEFRPLDAQCAILSSSATLNLEGRYKDKSGYFLDLCFRTPSANTNDDDDETVEASLQRMVNGVVVNEFLTGNWSNDGKVFTGTWYEDFRAGAILMYLRNNGDIDYSRWTGLVKGDGDTFVNQQQAHDPSRHQTGTFLGPRAVSTANQCNKYEILETYVLKNLHVIANDDNLYYFVDNRYLDPENQIYFRESESGASATFLSLAVVFCAFVVAMC